jgi:hypothetical protein
MTVAKARGYEVSAMEEKLEKGKKADAPAFGNF